MQWLKSWFTTTTTTATDDDNIQMLRAEARINRKKLTLKHQIQQLEYEIKQQTKKQHARTLLVKKKQLEQQLLKLEQMSTNMEGTRMQLETMESNTEMIQGLKATKRLMVTSRRENQITTEQVDDLVDDLEELTMEAHDITDTLSSPTLFSFQPFHDEDELDDELDQLFATNTTTTTTTTTTPVTIQQHEIVDFPDVPLDNNSALQLSPPPAQLVVDDNSATLSQAISN